MIKIRLYTIKIIYKYIMSFLEYSKITPNSNVGIFMNSKGDSYSGNMGSNEIPIIHKSVYNGGGKKLKNKIKNITKIYKMKGTRKEIKRKTYNIKQKLFKIIKNKSKDKCKCHNNTKNHKHICKYNKKSNNKSKKMRGGNHGNVPYSQGYGFENGSLRPTDSALATPTPFTRYTITPN